MDVFLGIDVGSSKTHALIANEGGRCVGFGKAWGGNHQSVGYDGLAEALKNSMQAACETAGVSAEQVKGAGFGIAGYDFPSDREAHLDAIRKLGLTCPLEVVNDGVLGLLAGSASGVGVNVTAGSSVNCRGRGENGEEGRIVGNGAPFGEFGGGMEIAMKALQMVNYAWIKRIPPTTLTRILLEATGAKDELDLMEGMSNDYLHLFPYIAVEVVNAAWAGDAAAQEVMRWAGEELGWLAVAVGRQIGMAEREVEVILSGSIFKAGEILTRPMRRVIKKHCPKAKIRRLNCPPAAGAVALGMQAAGVDWLRVRREISRTAKKMMAD